MQIFCRKPSFTLFDRERLRSYVPSKFDTFRERSVGLGRPLRPPPRCALERTACGGRFSSCRSDGFSLRHRVAWARVLLACRDCWKGHTKKRNRNSQLMGHIDCRSLTALRGARALDPRRHAGGKHRRQRHSVAERRHRADAGDARNLRGTTASLSSRHRSLRTAQQYIGGCGLFARDAQPLRPRRISGGLQCGTRTVRRLSEERPAASRRDTQLCRHACARDRRAWHSVPFRRCFNGIAIDDVWRRS